MTARRILAGLVAAAALSACSASPEEQSNDRQAEALERIAHALEELVGDR